MKNKFIKQVINKCLEDELILVRPAEESAKLYGVPYKKMLFIRRLVRFELGRKHGISYIREKDAERQVYRILRSLKNADDKYPGMLREIYEGGVLAAIGRKFGMQRQRVHQYKDKIETVLNTRGQKFLIDFIYKELPSSAKTKSKPPKSSVKRNSTEMHRRRKKRDIDVLTEVEYKYPGMLAEITAGNNKAKISEMYGISRQRIYEIETVLERVPSNAVKELIS